MKKTFKVKIESEVDLLKKLYHVSSPISTLILVHGHDYVRIISCHNCVPKVGKWDKISKSSCLFMRGALKRRFPTSNPKKSGRNRQRGCSTRFLLHWITFTHAIRQSYIEMLSIRI